MSKLQVPTEKETMDFLNSASVVNNFWSALNNFKQGNSTEGYRSVQLLLSDIVNILKDYTESKSFQKISKWVDVQKAYEIFDRLFDNVILFIDKTNPNHSTYDNGYVSKSTIIDIFADINALADIILGFIGKIPTIKFNPINVIFNILSFYATTTSNSMNSHPDWNNKQLIHSSEIDSFILDGALLTLENWPVFIKPLLDTFDNYVPKDLQNWVTPDQTIFYGDIDGKVENDIIDPRKFFDDAYIIYGNAGHDILYGGIKDDYLNGGKGNDTLNGGKGNDTLVDESGYDHYYIQDRDIIHDLDGEGRIYLNQYDLSKFEFKFEAENLWRAFHGKKALFQAIRNNDDLTIQSLTGKNDSVLIVDYFNRSKQTAEQFIGLDLKLNKNDQAFDFSNAPINTLSNLYNIVYMGGYQGKQSFIGGNRADIFFSPNTAPLSIDGKDGNDRIYGGTGNDKIFGSERKDLLQGGRDINTFRINFSNSYLYT